MRADDIPVAYLPDHVPGLRRPSRDDWDRVRDGYLAGCSATLLAEQFNVSLSAIRQRARAEGWRRSDLPDPDMDAPATCAELAADGRPDFGVMADTAVRRAARAVYDGRLAEALGWTRVGRDLLSAHRRERKRTDE